MTYRFPDVEGQPQVLPAPFVKMSVARPSCVKMASFIFLIMTLFFQKGKAFPGSAFHGGHGARVVCVCVHPPSPAQERMYDWRGVPYNGSNNLQAADTCLTP